MPNPRNLNYVLGSVGQSLQDLSAIWPETIPPLQCVVINKATGLPGEGIGWFLTDVGDFKSQPRGRQREIVNAKLADVFRFLRWRDVLRHFGLDSAPASYSALVTQAASFRASGESEEHRRLKEYVAAHSEICGLAKRRPASLEYALPSGDTVDVCFLEQREWVGAEVKARHSDEPDLVRGLFQCVKYRAVLSAARAAQGLPSSARAVLVLEGTLPASLLSLRNTLGIDVVELAYEAGHKAT